MIRKDEILDFHWRRQYSLFQVSAYAYGWLRIIKEMTDERPIVAVKGEDKWASIYSTNGSLALAMKTMEAAIKNDDNFVEKEIEKLMGSGEEWVRFAKNINVNNETSNLELFEVFKEYFKLLEIHGFSLFKSFYCVEISEIFFNRVIDKYVPDAERIDAIKYYSIPTEKAHVMKIADYFKEEKDTEKRTNFLEKNTPWILSADLFSSLPTRKDLSHFASSFPTEEINQKSKKVDLPKKAHQTVKFYQRLLFIKDKRDEYRRQAFYYGSALTEELIRRFNLNREELWHILPDEIELLDKSIDRLKEDLTKRKTAYLALYQWQKPIEIISGGKALDYLKKDVVTLKDNSFEGIRASKGKVTGEVQIIESAEDVKNFKAGKILVAITTNPDYVPAMQKAIAFITDEGGITSHAAIIARELNKPCVVGTKIATKALKDGDMVEIDAEKGIVRKLN